MKVESRPVHFAQVARAGTATLAVLLSVCFVGILVAFALMAGGHRVLIVMSGSMEPVIPVGSVVIVAPVEPAGLRAGDIITFVTRSGISNTHRITEVVEDAHGLGYRTRGDQSRADDSELARPVNVLGRAWQIVPLAGYLLHLAQQPAIKIIVAGLALLVITAPWLGSALVNVARTRKTATKESTSMSEPAAS